MLGQKLLPVAEVSCFLSIDKYPLISTAIMSGATARVAGSGHIMGASSPVKNPGRRATPWLFGICKYSRLQGSCPQRAKSLQIRAPVDACRAA
jgi:hypothetical protein